MDGRRPLKHFPFYISFGGATSVAYRLFYDSFASCVFDLGREVNDYRRRYRYFQADDGDLDYI